MTSENPALPARSSGSAPRPWLGQVRARGAAPQLRSTARLLSGFVSQREVLPVVLSALVVQRGFSWGRGGCLHATGIRSLVVGEDGAGDFPAVKTYDFNTYVSKEMGD